jgi:hypothetical protein
MLPVYTWSTFKKQRGSKERNIVRHTGLKDIKRRKIMAEEVFPSNQQKEEIND